LKNKIGKQYGLDFIITFVLKHTSMSLKEIYELTPNQLSGITNNIFEILKMENGESTENENMSELKTAGNNSNMETMNTMNTMTNKEEIINAAKQKIFIEAIKKAKEQGKTVSTKDLYKLFKGF